MDTGIHPYTCNQYCICCELRYKNLNKIKSFLSKNKNTNLTKNTNLPKNNFIDFNKFFDRKNKKNIYCDEA
jgi:hypothetical protein